MKKIALLLAVVVLFPFCAMAQAVAPVDTVAKQAYLVDANTGAVLYAKEADTQMTPSSMTKMLTMYLVFEALRDGKIKLDDTLTASEHAWKMGHDESSSMFLNIGQKPRVEELIRGVIIQSGNDAATVFAEGLGGSEESFAEMMNTKAAKLGMKNSRFVNAAGLPDPEQYSSAHDLAILAATLIHDFPEYYHYFSEMSFTYNNIKQDNRNPLLYHTMNVDGLKTGHTDAGGYGLTASALRNNRRLILVLNGLPDKQSREDESSKLLDWGYREFGLYPIASAGDNVGEAKIWLGQAPSVPLLVSADVTVTLPRAARAGLKAEAVFDQPVPAPITKGQQIGKLVITAPGMEPEEVPLLAAASVDRVGFFARIAAKLHLILHKDA